VEKQGNYESGFHCMDNNVREDTDLGLSKKEAHNSDGLVLHVQDPTRLSLGRHRR
jgi:hypothetical protein